MDYSLKQAEAMMSLVSVLSYKENYDRAIEGRSTEALGR